MNICDSFLRFCGVCSLLLVLICCDNGNTRKFKVATYNAGLATGFVEFAEQRTPLVAAAVTELDADVVCLQEIWLPEQTNAILAATQAAFPFSYLEVTRAETTRDNGASCSETELEPLLGCLEQNCAGVDPDAISGCALANCGDQFSDTSAACQTCLAANLGQTIENIVANCTTGGADILFEGHNGLLLLSKYPMTDTELHLLESYFVRRAVLSATVSIDGFSPVDVYCTHLSSAIGGVPYNGPLESWEAEQSAQIDDLLAHISRRTPPGRKAVLLGDMNSGPETANVDAEFAENFAKFDQAGFWSPYLANPGHRCTWCAENPLIGSGENQVIDHVLLYQIPTSRFTTNRRIFDQAVQLSDNGEAVVTRLSDHYGVRTVIWSD